MRLPAIILVILLFSLPIYSQTYRMYGNILDKETGEVLVGAHLYRENKSGQKIGAENRDDYKCVRFLLNVCRGRKE